jgi:hypothetical protein
MIKNLILFSILFSSLSAASFTTEEIQAWLFEGKADERFPLSDLPEMQNNQRLQAKYGPKINFSNIPMLGNGRYTHRIGIYDGGITDLFADKGLQAAVGTSNIGDLFAGSGAAISTAIINATGPNLQRDLYNGYGIPNDKMKVAAYGKEHYSHTEGRGYSLSFDAHDMRITHNIAFIEWMVVPMYSEEGVRNMYREAFQHSEHLDWLAIPMVGMGYHPVVMDKPELAAKLVLEEFKNFVDAHPDSQLRIVFAIFNKPTYEKVYAETAHRLDNSGK